MIQGQLRADALVIMSVQVDLVQRRMTAKMGLVSTTNGQTYGTSECSLWSNATKEQLGLLLASMEHDLREAFMSDGQPAAAQAERHQLSQDEVEEAEGLGELFGSAPAL